MTNIKYDLAFGNSVVVRQAFLETYNNDMVVFTPYLLEKFGYPEKAGDPELIEITREVIKRQSGQEYKHILLTNGATGGVVIALRSYAKEGFDWCYTRNAPWYMRYPSMIRAAGMHQHFENNPYPNDSWKHVMLMDFPSNPLGLTTDMRRSRPSPMIIDAVYHGRVYSRVFVPLPKHEVLVGSYSKLTGINGIRVGWIATNDEKRYEKMLELTTAEYCGISAPSTHIIKQTLLDFNWEKFEARSQGMLDDNREQFARLEKYFLAKIPDVGMFFYGETDNKCKELMNKVGIDWTSGMALGTYEHFVRLNMGQDRELVKNAIDDFLKADKIKK